MSEANSFEKWFIGAGCLVLLSIISALLTAALLRPLTAADCAYTCNQHVEVYRVERGVAECKCEVRP